MDAQIHMQAYMKRNVNKRHMCTKHAQIIQFQFRHLYWNYFEPIFFRSVSLSRSLWEDCVCEYVHWSLCKTLFSFCICHFLDVSDFFPFSYGTKAANASPKPLTRTNFSFGFRYFNFVALYADRIVFPLSQPVDFLIAEQNGKENGKKEEKLRRRAVNEP